MLVQVGIKRLAENWIFVFLNMPKPNFVLSQHQKTELFKKLCIHVGFPIRTKLDCLKVSELIDQAGLPGISESTIYRLFLLPKNSNQPYLHTLNILAKFCGYNSWNTFELEQLEVEKMMFGFGKFEAKNTAFKSLITVCIHNNELKPLLTYTAQFEQFNAYPYQEKFAEEIFQAVLTNKNNEDFFQKFSHFSVIRNQFFEILADPTFSIPNYETGLKYYLKDLNYEKSVKDLQDTLFGNCLLFRHYYVTQQTDKAIQLGKFLFKELNLNDAQLARIHVFPVARYIACQLMYFDILQQQKQLFTYFDQIIFELSQKMDSYTNEEQRILFYSIGEALVMNSMSTKTQHEQLKTIFKHLFDAFPKRLFEQKLDLIVPYFNKNSSIYQF